MKKEELNFGKVKGRFFDMDLCIEILKDKNIYNIIDKEYKDISYPDLINLSLSIQEKNLIKTYIYLNSKNNYNKYFYNGFNINSITEYIKNYSYSSKKINKLVELYQKNKDNNIKELLIYSHQYIIMKYALKKTEDLNLLLDLFQEGNIGLLMAIENYKSNDKFPFYIYAFWYVKKHINSYVEKNRCYLNMGLNKFLINKKIFDFIEEYQIFNNKYPSYEEMFVKFKISKEEYIDIFNSYNVISFNEIEEDEEELIENTSDNIDFREEVEDKYIYERALNEISKIVNKNSFIAFKNSVSEDSKPYEELGKELNITRQGVGYNYKIAIKRARKNKKVKQLLNKF